LVGGYGRKVQRAPAKCVTLRTLLGSARVIAAQVWHAVSPIAALCIVRIAQPASQGRDPM